MTTGFQSPTGVGVAPAHWQDTGCDVSDSCLACPLARCKHDDPNYNDADVDMRAARYRRIFELKKAGVPAMEIARQFSLSKRTVNRAIAQGGVFRPSGPKQVSDLSTERPLIDPCKFAEPFAKPLPPGGPSLYAKTIVNYRQACKRCKGTVRVDLHEKTATCLACGRDAKRRVA